MMLGSRTGAWQSGKKLPFKRRLAYLESTGTQWIDTGLKSSPIEVPFEIACFNVNEGYICGGGTSSTEGFGVRCRTVPKNGVVSIGYAWTQTINYWNKAFSGEYYTVGVIIKDNNFLYTFNGVGENTVNCPSSDSNFILFGRKVGDTVEPSKVRIFYSIKGQQSLIPVMDFNDVPCMFDEVSGQFFYNQGTGEFTWGELTE